MITIPLDETGTRHLMDREALARWVFLAEITIRRRCKPVDHDPATGASLYAAEACREELENVRRLPKLCADGVRRATRA